MKLLKKMNYNIGDNVEVSIDEDGIKFIPVKEMRTIDRLYGALKKNDVFKKYLKMTLQ